MRWIFQGWKFREAKRKAIERAMANGEPTESLEENYTVKDEEMIKKLYGLK